MSVTNTGYYRHATISGDTLAFVCEDDLWIVDLNGSAPVGPARRLSANPGDAYDGGTVCRDWLRSKGNSIEGGTTEVQLNIISKRVLGLPDA